MSMRQRTELDLFLALAKEDDPAVLHELTDRLRRCVFWVLNRMTNGRRLFGDIEDIVSEARLRLERLRERGFRGGAPEFKSYLYKVVTTTCIDAAHDRNSTDSLDAPVTLPDGDEKPLRDVARDMVDGQLSAASVAEAGADATRVRAAIERLDPRCRNLLWQFHVDERPIKELATAEGTRVNTIEVALVRCRQRLYSTFLSVYADASDRGWKARVTGVAGRLEGRLGEVFRAWWVQNRSVAQISKELGMDAGETRYLLGKAKFDMWQALEDPAGAP
jgi:RNA polymerase sigma factor (sigma-70 family)